MSSSSQTLVSDTRFARLARGTNAANWFWLPSKEPQPYKPQDFAIMKSLGLTFVRLPIDFATIYDAKSPSLLNTKALAKIDAAIAQIQSYGLAVVVDLHSTPGFLDDNDYSGALENPAFRQVFINFWQSFAAHLGRTTNPELTFLQPMNEPVFQSNPDAWAPIQTQLLQTIRASAPNHTLVAVSALWQNIDTLITLQPLADRNVVYDFHFYEPFVFTHQGAEWIDGYVQDLKQVPYPSTPQNIQPLLQQFSGNPTAIADLTNYGAQQWNRNKVRQSIARAAKWASDNGVRLMSSEFGVYGKTAPAGDRVQWMADVRSAFEEFKIGWASWGYKGDFGYVDWKKNVPTLDAAMLQALGLNTTLQFNGTEKRDTLTGTSLADGLNGLGGNDLLSSYQGDDLLRGGNGRDRLLAGDGNDLLRGDKGVDLLIGGKGADIFVLERRQGLDRVQDFVNGVDRLGLLPGLTFKALTIWQVGQNTQIGVGNEAIAVLLNTNAKTINAADFSAI